MQNFLCRLTALIPTKHSSLSLPLPAAPQPRLSLASPTWAQPRCIKYPHRCLRPTLVGRLLPRRPVLIMRPLPLSLGTPSSTTPPRHNLVSTGEPTLPALLQAS